MTGNGAEYLERFGLVDNSVMALSPTLQGLQITSEDVIDIGKGLVENWSLTSLELGRCNVGVTGAYALAEALAFNHTLRYLGLAHNTGIGDVGCQAIAESLEGNQTLEILDLTGCCVGDFGVLAVSQMLEKQLEVTETKKCGEVRSLIMSRNKIGVPGAAALSAALAQTKKLKSLDLSGNRLREAGCTALADGLRFNKSVTHLNIGRNDINPEGGRALFTGLLENTTITALHLQRNRLGGSVVELAELCNVNPQLRDINLESCCVDAEVAKAFGERLISPSFLMVNLGMNAMSDTGVTALCGGLRGKVIRYLDLSQVGMTADSVGAVCELVRVAPCLQTLQMDRNLLGEDGAAMLAEVFTTNTMLDSVNIGETGLGNLGVIRVIKGLTNNLLLRILDVSTNGITNDGCVEICEVLSQMCRLSELDLSSNEISSSPAVIKSLCSLFPNNASLSQVNISGCPVGDLYDGGLFTRYIALESCGVAGLPEIKPLTLGRTATMTTPVQEEIRYRVAKHDSKRGLLFRPAWAPALPPPKVYGDELRDAIDVEDEELAEDGNRPPLITGPGSLLHPLYPGFGRGRACNATHCDTLYNATTLPMYQSGYGRPAYETINSSASMFQAPAKRLIKKSPYSLSAVENNIGGLPVTEEALRRKFQELDVDGSGYLDYEEFKVIFSNFQNFGLYQSANEVDSIMKQHKVLEDGRISFDEFVLIMLSLARR